MSSFLSNNISNYGSNNENQIPSISIQNCNQQQDSKIIEIREQVLKTIVQYIPITPLFTPELKINLGLFFKDQMFFQEIAEFLAPLSEKTPIDKELIEIHFQNSNLLLEIKSFFKDNHDIYLTFFYEACTDALNNQLTTNHLKPAMEGRIFTLKNALIAQKTPKAILNSQITHKITQQSISKIQEEGAGFIRDSLSIHLNHLNSTENFKDLLASTSNQLIPFVQKVTNSYLTENRKDYSGNPLTFRNPTGHNYHGLVAATVMETCLEVLGYKTRIMLRSDLEPKVTLATTHSVVKVTAPDHSIYIVDPCFTQFHKDICTDDSFPESPLLVLFEDEIDTYIENNLMNNWRNNFSRLKNNDLLFKKKLEKQDQLLSYIIESPVQPEVTTDRENWVKKSLKRVWDIHTYSPVLSNQGFQEIFIGIGDTQKTYNYIKDMGISALSTHLSIVEVEKNLNSLLSESPLENQNSLKALSLISQLPKIQRNKYISLLDLDPRIDGIGITLNAYFRSLKKMVNSEGQNKSVIYGCSGADCTSVFLATDAQDFTFVDLTDTSYQEFKIALDQLKISSNKFAIQEKLSKSFYFLSTRSNYGGASSVYYEGKQMMVDLALKLLFDLQGTGVDLNEITLSPVENGKGVRLDFPWQYHGTLSARNRSVTFLTADITNPETYPALLQAKLEAGIDMFYMKASFLAPKDYPQFLPHIAKSIKEGGWIMTTDKTFTMDAINPEVCLRENGLNFEFQRSKATRIFENLITPPFDPLISINLLNQVRKVRCPGSDLTYWAILNLRKKIS